MKKITPVRLKNIALYYLERYDANTFKLREILIRRLKKARLTQEVSPEANLWVDQTVDEMVRLGYVNDKRFAENFVLRLKGLGKSPIFIRTKLKQVGVTENIITNVLDETDEITQARLMVQKKKMGSDYKRDLARLARAGFSYEIARQVLSEISSSSEDF